MWLCLPQSSSGHAVAYWLHPTCRIFSLTCHRFDSAFTTGNTVECIWLQSPILISVLPLGEWLKFRLNYMLPSTLTHILCIQHVFCTLWMLYIHCSWTCLVRQIERFLASVTGGSKPSVINFSQLPSEEPLVIGRKGWIQKSLGQTPC
jgi:hypothetical protein